MACRAQRTYHIPFSTVDSNVSPVKSTVNDGTDSSLTSAVGGAASEMRGRKKTGRIVERRMFATLWRPLEDYRSQ